MAAVLTVKATVRCSHQFPLTFQPSQQVLDVDGDFVLVGKDVLAAVIACTATPTKCTKVLTIEEGLSTKLHIGDGQVVLENAHGTTDAGTWTVTKAGQTKLEAT